MKLNEFRTPEYSAPTCKVVTLHSEMSLLANSVTGGNDSLEGMNKRDVSDWGWDEEE